MCNQLSTVSRYLVEAHEKNPEIIHEKFGVRNESILHRAALNSRIEMVEFLLEHGAQQSEVNASLSLSF